MKRFLSCAAVAVFVGVATPALAAPTVYAVNAQAGTSRVTGTITTDGTIGVLRTANITDYFFTLTNADSTGTIDSAESRIFQIGGTAFTATESDLLFDYSASAPGSGFYFISMGFSDLFCSNADAGFACGNNLHNELSIIVSGVNETVTRSGVQSISNAAAAVAAVPEPATWGMMILGFGLAGTAMRRRIRASEVRFDARIKRISEGDAA